MPAYLDRILDAHRARAADDGRSLDVLMATVSAMAPPRDFPGALRRESGVSVIAEIKRRSPSKGELAPSLDAAVLAKDYAAGGAAALSVLTDREFFGGSPEDLVAARDASGLPVLRKDFTVNARDICDARIMGADAVLLIVAALSAPELIELVGFARSADIAALVEVHDREEVLRAAGAGAALIGVNQRDLETFEIDPERALALAEEIPDGAVRVAESGIGGPSDIRRLRDAGYDAVLVGEALVTSRDPRAAVAGLRQAGACS